MNEKRNILDMANLLSEKHDMQRKDAELFIRTMLDVVEESLSNEKYVKIKGLGTFKLTEVDSRESVNVNTGERIEIQGHTKVSFTPDTTIKELINKPFSHFETVMLNEGVMLEDTLTETEVSEVKEQQENPVVTDVKPIQEEIPTPKEDIAVSEELTEVHPEAPMPQEEVSVSPAEIPTASQEEPEKEESLLSIPPQAGEKKTSHFLWGIIVVLVLIILFGGYWLFLRPADESVEETPTEPPVQEEVVAPTPVTEDTTQVVFIDNPITMAPLNLSPEELRKERVPMLSDTLEYRINGTLLEKYALQNGETIIKVSVKFFGSKRFWPYIAKYNSNIIKDPDNIPVGTSIRIPAIVPKE